MRSLRHLDAAQAPWRGVLALGEMYVYCGTPVVSGARHGPMEALRNEGWEIDRHVARAASVAASPNRQHSPRPQVSERQ